MSRTRWPRPACGCCSGIAVGWWSCLWRCRQEGINTFALSRSRRQPGQRRRARRRSGRRDQCYERPALGGSKDPDIQTQAFLWSKGQVDQTIFNLSAQHQLRFDFATLHISRRRRRDAHSVVLEDSLHLFAASNPLPAGDDFGAVVHHQHLGHGRPGGQLFNARQWFHRRSNRRNRYLAWVGAGTRSTLRTHLTDEGPG